MGFFCNVLTWLESLISMKCGRTIPVTVCKRHILLPYYNPRNTSNLLISLNLQKVSGTKYKPRVIMGRVRYTGIAAAEVE